MRRSRTPSAMVSLGKKGLRVNYFVGLGGLSACVEYGWTFEVMYYTYIVASRSHNFYVGVTSKLEARIRQHREGDFDGYSKRYRCNRLVWFERHSSVHMAFAREK